MTIGKFLIFGGERFGVTAEYDSLAEAMKEAERIGGDPDGPAEVEVVCVVGMVESQKTTRATVAKGYDGAIAAVAYDTVRG